MGKTDGAGKLKAFIGEAIELGAERIELEYKDGKQWIFAYRGPMGFGMGNVDSNSDESEQLFREMDELKKTKQVTVDGVDHRLAFSKYESFGEWVFRIEFKGPRRKPRRA